MIPGNAETIRDRIDNNYGRPLLNERTRPYYIGYGAENVGKGKGRRTLRVQLRGFAGRPVLPRSGHDGHRAEYVFRRSFRVYLIRQNDYYTESSSPSYPSVSSHPEYTTLLITFCYVPSILGLPVP